MKTDKGEINVFLCPDGSSDSPHSTNNDPLFDDIKPLLSPTPHSKYLSPKLKTGKLLFIIVKKKKHYFIEYKLCLYI